jgi:hypothetical protein
MENMNLSEIFDEVVSITHNDYAGCLDKKGWDSPEEFKEKLKDLENQGLLNSQSFSDLVSDYLLDFKDQHMTFKLSANSGEEMMTIGFMVRSYEDLLYIYEVGKETRVQKGMAIQSIDGLSIPELSVIHNKLLLEKKHEREVWGPILKKYKTCEIMDQNGQTFILELKLYEPEKWIPSYSINKINKNTLLMKLTDFFNPDVVERLLKEHEQELSTCTNLIIDVRINHGGSDVSYFSLLNYIVDRDCNLEGLAGSDDCQLFNCTANNYTNKVLPMEEALDTFESEETRKFLNIYINEFKKNIGKGFVQLDFSELVDDVNFEIKPDRVLILSDFFAVVQVMLL